MKELRKGRTLQLASAKAGMDVKTGRRYRDLGRFPSECKPDAAPCGPRQIGRQLAINVLPQPHAWNVAKRVPILRLGAEDQSYDERPSRLSAWQAQLGLLALERVDECNEARRVAEAGPWSNSSPT